MSTEALLPAIGCWVVRCEGEDREKRPGHVKRILKSGLKISLSVHWIFEKQDDVIALDRVECGLRPGFDVWHSPESQSEPSLGFGTVVKSRVLGGRQQLLVDFTEQGSRLWIPWQRLRFAKSAAFRFRHGDKGGAQAAERLRLRNLAYALKLWNENTGSLSKFDIDPLPHQIHLVHHILASGNLNWLVADDVGLGKTIEAGLLIAALRQRGAAKRVLLVVPAGLTRQWQDDMKIKFGLDDFLIYGSDFSIADNAYWKMYDRVIASMDKLKGVDHLERILAAEPWDLVIFDEAHRLTRRQWGMKFERSDRYRLAEQLRNRTPALLMLSATPHQGRSDQFTSLLELLRPEMSDQFKNIDMDASVLSQMVFRNRKSDVTDMDGNFVFHGQTSRMVQVESNPDMRELERHLREYFQQGYSAADRLPGQQAKAIGFVMTVYRKLAASSIVALRKALARRLARLKSMPAVTRETVDEDYRYIGEWEETADNSREEFFGGEKDRINTLVQMCMAAEGDDLKMLAFLNKIIDPILQRNDHERVLVFTEYRGTQEYIVRELAARYGAGKVHVVNGSMDVEERLQSIARFEKEGQFLVSTEAGGEGINLHRRCHLLVNYDLPWNPMRLAQRIGRLYRYGQKRHVVAFNLQGIESADELIVAKMYERLDQVAKDMAQVDGATSESLVSDIVGQLAALIDVEDILEAARNTDVQRTEERIEDALRRARESSDLQKALFQHAVSYDPNEMRAAFPVSMDHLRAFTFGMLEFLGGSVHDSRLFFGKAWRIGLPDMIVAAVPGLGREPLVTFDREVGREEQIILLDMDNRLIRWLLAVACDYDFEGLTAAIVLKGAGHVMTSILRWQDERGNRMRQEFVVVSLTAKRFELNPGWFSEWLLVPARAITLSENSVDREIARTRIDDALDGVLAERSSRNLHPESREWLSATWCDSGTISDELLSQ
ncbi:helicase-related protein [Xanthomonas sp. LMG 12462]|uniref:helicase-related protein n=1 Tax=Xanthomonas sp. LMG 12462 TaxID=1591134 RepID=UPI00126567E6|nr:helicase-related protein [Xanthomonas sp. LMG 12462]KAB7764939.1 helicase [Xanthomonas sp. LMG 12462]